MDKNRNILNSINWHSLGIEETLARLNTNKTGGLYDSVIEKRLKEYGPNKLPDAQVISLFNIVFRQLLNPLIFILLVAAIVSLLIGEIKDTIFILLVIMINSAIGAYQEFKAEKSAASLKTLLRVKAKVLRNNKILEIDSEKLVPGDIVLLESGVKVPADIRLIEVKNLESDESLLTGESIPVSKSIENINEKVSLSEIKNMCFAGTTILNGRARGVVVNTGLNTEIGLIASEVIDKESAKPPLLLRMEVLIKQISSVIILLSILLGVLLNYQGMDLNSIFFFIVALAVSSIPEGLPVAMTVALSVATKRMANKNVIVKQLNSVESLGSCTVIASDKTGTLTVNEQTVKEVHLINGDVYNVLGQGYNGVGEIRSITNNNYQESEDFMSLLRVATLSNEAELRLENSEWIYSGDSMDVALLGFTYKAIQNLDLFKSHFEVIDSIPYESELKYSAVIYKSDDSIKLGVKGAVETVINFCSNKDSNQNHIKKDSILKKAEKLAAKGYRVLAFAEKSINKSELNPSQELFNLTFLGFVCFIDPLRENAKESVTKCKKAGIKVIMITGDHPATAKNIAEELGILDSNNKIITGKELEIIKNRNIKDYNSIISNSNVFARVSPSQKLDIVNALIESGEFVAVTGDGVNDAPALRKANLGVAMGSGTDVAKEVGSMIIVNDDFSSIVTGVEEGRFAYSNVRKVIYLLVSTGAAEVVLFLGAILTSLPLPLLAVQLLWLNLVTNGFQHIALAFEKGEPELMYQKPRKPSENIFNKLMIKQTLLSSLVMGLIVFGLWYYLIEFKNADESVARNSILLLMVFMQNFHVFNCRSEKKSAFKIPIKNNKLIIIAVILAQGAHILSMQAPFMQDILRITPIHFNDWVLILCFAIPLIIIMELFKKLNNYKEVL